LSQSLYGHDYKPRSKMARNVLLGIGAVIILITFVWTTYDDKTFRLLDAKNTRSADVPQSIDAGAPRSRETGSGQLPGSPKKM
jgi:hypothetical protein